MTNVLGLWKVLCFVTFHKNLFKSQHICHFTDKTRLKESAKWKLLGLSGPSAQSVSTKLGMNSFFFF